MATYNSFKKIHTESIIDNTLLPVDIADASVENDQIAEGGIESASFKTANLSDTKFDDNEFDISSKTVTYRAVVNNDINSSASIAPEKFNSTAFTNNLGGTPVNKNNPDLTGGTFKLKRSSSTTDIGLGYGVSGFTAGITARQSSGTNDLIELTAGSNKPALRVDHTGGVTHPNRPAFHAAGTSGWRYGNSYGGNQWRALSGNFGWSVEQQGGTNFNTSNGAFTAPVSGFYQFHFQTYFINASTTRGYIHLSFGVNGGVAMSAGRAPHGIFGHSNVTSSYPHGVVQNLGNYLSAGQYTQVWVYWADSRYSRFHGAHSHFNGFMIS